MTVSKVHPYPPKRHNVCDLPAGRRGSVNRCKKLRRMPHLFAKVLELPFHSEAPVEVHETADCYTFELQQSGLVAEEVRTQVLEIVPGAVKVVIAGAEDLVSALKDMEVDCWRFRLPPYTSPEASSAIYEDEVLIVTVPKVLSHNLLGFKTDTQVTENTRDFTFASCGQDDEKENIVLKLTSEIGGTIKSESLESKEGDGRKVMEELTSEAADCEKAF